ncbi:F-BAR domain only protein 1-like isoform X1 [Tachypleus tridentatus]|uniref:F-BAR domain only protein 1-like isoform X1 n=1 Tax=Tachypleus tridentatus TaxID=6853 RepID=UPI003FD166FE
MMTINFIDYFWGEKNDGFEVLYNNMKNGTSDCKELVEFFKERFVIEDSNSKALSRLAKHAGSGLTHGTFGPLWQMVKSSADKLSHLHNIMVERLQGLVKDINHYCEDQQKKHKQVKSKQMGTVDVIQAFQHIAATVLKAKENCYKRYIEVQKLRECGASKELEKAETKHRKACDEYCSCVKRYNQLRIEFEKKMALACQIFQQVEEEHLQQMKKFLTKYSQVLENCYILMGQANLEFKQQCNEIDVSSLLEQFVKKKGTGIEVPGPVEVEAFHLSSDHHFKMPDGASFRKANKSKIRSSKRFSIHTKKSGAVSMTDLYHTSNKDNESSIDISPSSSKPNHAFSVEDITSTSSTPTRMSRNSALARTALRASNFLFRSKRKRKKKKEMLNNHEHTAQDKSVIVNGRLLSPTLQSAPVIDSEGYTIRPPEEPSENILYNSFLLRYNLTDKLYLEIEAFIFFIMYKYISLQTLSLV